MNVHAVNAKKSAWCSSYLWFFNQRNDYVFKTKPQLMKTFSFLLVVPLCPCLTCCISLSFGYSVTWSPSLRGPSSETEGDRALGGYEAPWRGERDRGRRPRQYICPGESRKTSERFRTQPITSAERQETDRYFSGLRNAWLREKNAGKYPWFCMSKKSEHSVDFEITDAQILILIRFWWTVLISQLYLSVQ